MSAPDTYFEVTDLLHGSCRDCDNCAQDAAVNASVTGSTGATSSIEAPLTSETPGAVLHSATVRRLVRAVVIPGTQLTKPFFRTVHSYVDQFGFDRREVSKSFEDHAEAMEHSETILSRSDAAPDAWWIEEIRIRDAGGM